MMKNPAVKLASVFAVAFFGAYLMSVFPNPVLGQSAWFVTNWVHDLVHLLTAVLFVIVSLNGERASILFMQIFGVIYLLVGVAGFVTLGAAPEGHLLHIIHINRLDNFLHVGLGLIIGTAGWAADYYSKLRLQTT